MAKNRKRINPFITSGYVSPEYFCDRADEMGKLKEAIISGRNMTLVSIRRMGKTGLLKHVQHGFENGSKDNKLVFIDLLPTQSAADLLRILGSALIRIRHTESGFIKKVLTTLAVLRPGLTYDSLSGQPALVFHVARPSELEMGFQQVMDLFSELKFNLTLVLDEFQQIMEYPEKNIESILRSIMQENPDVNFIFSGSNRHMMEAMFSDPSRPFYQSTEVLYLNEIKEEEYTGFIQKHFKQAGTVLDIELVQDILNWCRNHTFYVQYYCNRLYAKQLGEITKEESNEIKLEILESFEPIFSGYSKLMTQSQISLLQAIACEGEIRHPLSSDFIVKYKLGASSTVKTSLESLDKKEMTILTKKGWMVQNPYYSRWLEYHYNLKYQDN